MIGIGLGTFRSPLRGRICYTMYRCCGSHARRLAAERRDVPVLLLDVDTSAANRALAMEKTLTKPASQRKCELALTWLSLARILATLRV